jgi:two-component system, sensor histidine kinase and response regulator
MPYRLDPDEVEGSILLDEDNETNRIVAEAMLNKAGARFASVENGQMAVDTVTREDRPDLVLMDVQMPIMDGMTAAAFEPDQQSRLAAGMDGFMTKSVKIDELAATLMKWLRKKELERIDIKS